MSDTKELEIKTIEEQVSDLMSKLSPSVYTYDEVYGINRLLNGLCLNYIKIGDDGILELYCDHQMLSNLRTCEARFMLEHVYGVGGRGIRAWSLSFGIWLHYCLDVFYSHLKEHNGTPIDLPTWIEYGKKRWFNLDNYDEGASLSGAKPFSMEVYSPTGIAFHKNYKTLGGWPGAAALLGHYWAYFGQARAERFRVVATEVGFGKDKEVPIIDEKLRCELGLKFRAYLCGRIDLLIDDGNSIGPVDHKSTGYFTGKEHQHYNPHEGPTGYVLGVRTIVNSLFPDLIKQGRLCDSIWINHISLQVCDERFKRTRLRKSQSQLDEYIERQRVSFVKVFDLIMGNRKADWNTMVCDNIFHHACQYKALHEVAPENRPDVLNTHYVKIDLWNPYKGESIQ